MIGINWYCILYLAWGHGMYTIKTSWATSRRMRFWTTAGWLVGQEVVFEDKCGRIIIGLLTYTFICTIPMLTSRGDCKCYYIVNVDIILLTFDTITLTTRGDYTC